MSDRQPNHWDELASNLGAVTQSAPPRQPPPTPAPPQRHPQRPEAKPASKPPTADWARLASDLGLAPPPDEPKPAPAPATLPQPKPEPRVERTVETPRDEPLTETQPAQAGNWNSDLEDHTPIEEESELEESTQQLLHKEEELEAKPRNAAGDDEGRRGERSDRDSAPDAEDMEDSADESLEETNVEIFDAELVEVDFDDQQGDAESTDADSGESTEEESRGRRRRRRGRRGRRGGKEPRVSTESSDVEEDANEFDADDDVEGDSDEHVGRPNHRNITGWAEALDHIISTNMAARSQSPQGNTGGLLRGRGRRSSR